MQSNQTNQTNQPKAFWEEHFWSPYFVPIKTQLCCLAALLILKRQGIHLPDQVPYVDLLQKILEIDELKHFYFECKQN